MKGLDNYKCKTGERVLISPPNSDNENGYCFQEYQVLWQNDIFILYGNDGRYPNLHRKEHVKIKQIN